MKLRKLSLAIWAGCFGLGASAGVAAQEVSRAAEGQDEKRNAVSLDAVLVTAQRREERIQDVPISVTVLNAEQLDAAGVTTTNDLTAVTPGLKIDRMGAYTQPAIRGISSQLAQPGNDSNVAIYVDGVYQPNQLANTFDFADISHIEVLKGPQGTLFGRNAAGGAIQVYTREPEFTPTGDVTLGYGDNNDFLAKGFVTGPLAENLAGSLSFFYNTNDGYSHDLINGGRIGALDSRLVRGKLQSRIGDSSVWTLSMQYLHRQDRAATAGQALDGNTLARVVDPGVLLPTRPHDVALSFEPILDVENVSVSLRGDMDFGFASLRSITAYSDTKGRILLDGDYAAAAVAKYDIQQPDTNMSQEFVLTSQGEGRLSWIGGVFLYKDHAQWDAFVFNDVSSIYSGQKTQAYSAFGELNYAFSDKLVGIAGLRYSFEEKELQGGYSAVDGDTRIGKKSWDSVTPRLSLRYSLSDNSSAYATYSQGFKSGGFDTGNFAAPPVDPETVYAYEIGWKYADANGFHLNAAAFYYDYRDQQVTANSKINGIDLGILQNADKSEIYGLDLDGSAWLNDHWSLRAGLSLLHAEYVSYKGAALLRPTGYGGNENYFTEVDGNRMVRAPRKTLSLGVNYDRSFNTGQLRVALSGYYTDKFFFEAGNRVSQDSYATVGLNAAWEFGNSGWEASLWGKNLTDETIIQSVFLLESADGVSYAAPRTYGASVRYSF